METITKIQEELCSSYIDGEINEVELTDKLRYVKGIHDDMVQLRQTMADICSAPMDELCNTEVPVIDNISSIHKELMGKYAILKSISVTSNTPDNVDDEDDVNDTDTDDEDTDDEAAFNMIRYHIQLMGMFNNEDITSEQFVSSMTDACDLSNPVYKSNVSETREMSGNMLVFPVVSPQWEVARSMDVSNILICGLYMREYGKHKDGELEELIATYIAMLKETMETATSRCMATPISLI